MFGLQDMRSHRFAYKTEESHLDLVPLLSKLAFPLSHNAVSNFIISHFKTLWDYFFSYSLTMQREDKQCSRAHDIKYTNVSLFCNRFKKL